MEGRIFDRDAPLLPSFPVPTKGEKNEVLLYVLRALVEFRLESDYGVVPKQSERQACALRGRRKVKVFLQVLRALFEQHHELDHGLVPQQPERQAHSIRGRRKEQVRLQILRSHLEFHLEPDHGIVPQQPHSQARADVTNSLYERCTNPRSCPNSRLTDS